MTPRERVMEALAGNAPDIPPVAVFTQSATVGQMEATGISWPEAHSDPERMAALGCAQAEMFGFESVRVPFDITAEAGCLGCTVDMGTRTNLPFITGRAIEGDPVGGDLPDPDLPSPSEFVSGGRTATVCEAISICAKRVDGEYPVCGGMLGPLGLLGQLMSVESLALASFMQPDWVHMCAERLTPLLAEYARAQRDAGADVITIVESESSADIIDPSGYTYLSGSFIPGILPSGDVRTVLHMCGSTEPILPEIAATGADALSPDPKVKASDVVEGLGGRMRIAGSVDPVATLLMGTPDRVREEARMYAGAGFDVIIPGCGLAPLTPDENLRALAGAFRRRAKTAKYGPGHHLPWTSARHSWGPAAGGTPPCTRPAPPADS